jgi:hypothetical protein
VIAEPAPRTLSIEIDGTEAVVTEGSTILEAWGGRRPPPPPPRRACPVRRRPGPAVGR